MPRKRPAPASPPQPSLPAPSPLAVKNNLSASSEAEIRTAFAIFSTTTVTTSSSPRDHPAHNTSTDVPDACATMPTSALARALAALDCGPQTAAEKRQLTESVDPTERGEVRYEDFVALAALQLRRRTKRGGRSGARINEDEDEDDIIPDEVEAAFRLFLDAGGESGGKGREGESGGKGREGEERITIRGLRRVAKELGGSAGGRGGGGGAWAGMGEDVLRNMIMEANGLGPEGVGRGVGRKEFADVMRRAGVF